MDLKRITDQFTASPQLSAEDVKAAAALGFTALINNRPDGEEAGQPESAQIEAAAREAGLSYHAIPVAGGMITEAGVDAMTAALEGATGPVLAYCRSGTRSTMLWAVSAAQNTPADDLISAAADAGYDLTGLRPILEARHGGDEPDGAA